MSTEHTEPTAHYGDDGHAAGSATTPAQSPDSSGSQPATGSNNNNGRRRRRRRKSKGPAVAGAASVPGQTSEEDAATTLAAPPAPALPQPHSTNNPPQNNNAGMGGSGKRKNGRKRSGSAGAPQPGNGNPGQNRSRQARQPGQSNAWKGRSNEGPDGNREGARGGFGSSEHFQDNGNSNARRKGKFGRRGPTSFVGPMDHSYRTVNGNIADGSPSTLDFRHANANGNVNGRNDHMDVEPVSPLREDAPTRIVCFIEDLFVVAKMQETARKLGIKVQFAKAEKETLAAITEAPEAQRPSLIVFDLNNGKPLTTIPKLKSKLKRGTSIIGFLQHVQGDLKLKAIEAGCDSVMPRSAFSQNLPNLLRRHGLAEEEMMEA